jgi:Fe2+ transport system protein FeoA
MPLTAVPRGCTIIVRRIADAATRTHLLRVGLTEGMRAVCAARIFGGTFVLSVNRQEIALGRALAEQITVAILSPAK